MVEKKVICNKRNTCEEAHWCGGAKPHYPDSECNNCPRDKDSKCIECEDYENF